MRAIAISSLLVLTASVAVATTVVIQSQRVSPENMEEHGISVHSLTDEPGCSPSTLMLVQVPMKVSAAALTVRDSNGTVIVYAKLAIQEDPKEPAYRSGYVPPGMDKAPPYLIEMQERFSFLADGFRGVSFCLASTSLGSATLNLTSDRPPASWWLDPLSQWAK
jgi:hypothetical protein